MDKRNKGTNSSMNEEWHSFFLILKDELLLCYKIQGSLFILNMMHLYGFDGKGFNKMVCTFFVDGSLFSKFYLVTDTRLCSHSKCVVEWMCYKLICLLRYLSTYFVCNKNFKIQMGHSSSVYISLRNNWDILQSVLECFLYTLALTFPSI